MQCDLSPYRNKRICVALSGGSDSVALIDYLDAHKEEFSITLTAVNCEHGVRGKESLLDTAFVKKFCKERGIPLFLFSCDCVARAKRHKESLETACRNFRYECFDSLLREGKTDLIATAHHALDNAETILFRLCRGTSLFGLRGIADRAGYIRPLLQTSKREILNYLSERGLSYCKDATNDDESYTRNAIRKHILPDLEREIPGATANISRFSAIAAEDDEFLYSLAREKVKRADGALYVSECEKPLFTRAALIALKELGVKRDYTQAHLSALYSLLKKTTSARVSLPFQIEAEKEPQGVFLYKKRERSELEIPFSTGRTVLGDDCIIIDKKKDGQAFDIKKLPAGCVFRFRRAGDKITKFGGGTKKLKEYFNDKKIPLRKRDFIPLIAKENEIFCAVGVEISDKIRTDQTSDVWYIHYDHKGEN